LLVVVWVLVVPVGPALAGGGDPGGPPDTVSLNPQAQVQGRAAWDVRGVAWLWFGLFFWFRFGIAGLWPHRF